MYLSFYLEYYGNCREVINYYSTIFNILPSNVKTYKEMDGAELLGITGAYLEMIWQCTLTIKYGQNYLCLELADSILVAMQKEIALKNIFFKPTVFIYHNDEEYISKLYAKLCGQEKNIEQFNNSIPICSNGINWQFQMNCECGISYCLTFDGFCEDVIAFYEEVFMTKAKMVVKYKESPYNECLSTSGGNKIYNALLQFKEGNKIYSLLLKDSYKSALFGLNEYNPDALLFYEGKYNPIFKLKHNNIQFLFGIYNRLKIGAKINKPMIINDNEHISGSLIDKYGICWNLYA